VKIKLTLINDILANPLIEHLSVRKMDRSATTS